MCDASCGGRVQHRLISGRDRREAALVARRGGEKRRGEGKRGEGDAEKWRELDSRRRASAAAAKAQGRATGTRPQVRRRGPSGAAARGAPSLRPRQPPPPRPRRRSRRCCSRRRRPVAAAASPVPLQGRRVGGDDGWGGGGRAARRRRLCSAAGRRRLQPRRRCPRGGAASAAATPRRGCVARAGRTAATGARRTRQVRSNGQEAPAAGRATERRRRRGDGDGVAAEGAAAQGGDNNATSSDSAPRGRFSAPASRPHAIVDAALDCAQDNTAWNHRPAARVGARSGSSATRAPATDDDDAAAPIGPCCSAANARPTTAVAGESDTHQRLQPRHDVWAGGRQRYLRVCGKARGAALPARFATASAHQRHKRANLLTGIGSQQRSSRSPTERRANRLPAPV